MLSYDHHQRSRREIIAGVCRYNAPKGQEKARQHNIAISVDRPSEGVYAFARLNELKHERFRLLYHSCGHGSAAGFSLLYQGICQYTPPWPLPDLLLGSGPKARRREKTRM